MKRSILPVLAVALVGAAGSPTVHAASWSAATPVARDVGAPAQLLAPAVGRDGAMLLGVGSSSSPAADDHLNRAALLPRSAKGQLGPVRAVPSRLLALKGYGTNRVLALTIAHRAGQAFDRFHLRVADGRVDGHLGPVREIAGGRISLNDGAAPPVLAVASSGAALVTWAEKRGDNGWVLRAAERRPGSHFGAPRTLASNTGPGTAAAITARGAAAVVFEQSGHVVARLRGAAGGWRPVQRLRVSESDGDDAAVAITASGEVRAVWWRRWRDCVNHCEGFGPMVVHTAAVRAGGTAFGPVQTLTDSDDWGPTTQGLVRVPGGWALTYVARTAQGEIRPVLRTAKGAGAFGPERDLAPPVAAPGLSQAAAVYAPADGLVVGWRRDVLPPDAVGTSTIVATAVPLDPAAGAPGPPQQLSQPQGSDVALVADPRTRHARAFWTERPATTDPFHGDQGPATVLTAALGG